MSSFTNIIENFEEQYGVDTTRAALCLGLGLMANNEDDKADLLKRLICFKRVELLTSFPLSPFLSQKSNDRLLSTEKEIVDTICSRYNVSVKNPFCLMY